MKNNEELSSGPPRARRARFGGFDLDLERRALERQGERLRLTPKPLDTLIFLVQNRGRVVAKQELLEAVWRGTSVTEGTLVQAIREIRRALDDDKDDPAFVQTVPREGYRFVADVAFEELTSPAAPRPAPGRWLWAAGALVTALLALVAWWRWPAAPAAVQPEALHQLTSGPNAMKPVFSPDGKWLAYAGETSDAPGVLDLFVARSQGGSPRRVTRGADASGDMPVFTADGSALVFSRFRSGQDGSRLPDLWRVPISGGEPELFVADASGAGFSPDGRQVAYTRRRGAQPVLCVSGLEAPGNCREAAPRGFTPRYSPDGRWLAFTTSDTEGGPGELWLMSAGVSEARRLSGEVSQMYGLAWTPDSAFVVAASERSGSFQLWRYALDASAPRQLTSGVGSYASPTVSPDGALLAFSHSRSTLDLLLARLGDGAERHVTRHGYHLWPRLSPSGGRVASVVPWPGRGERLLLTETGSGSTRSLGRESASHPAWLDERRVAYLALGPGQDGSVGLIDTQTDHEEQLTRFEPRPLALAVHPSGPRVAVVLQASEGPQRLVVRDLQSGRDTLISEGLAYDAPAFSPDGRRLAWSGPQLAGDTASNGVWLSEPGSAPRRVLADGHGPVWSDDGQRLYVSRTLGPAGSTGLVSVDPRTGHERHERDWRRVPAFDLRGTTLLFTPEGGESQVYALALQPRAR